MKKILLTLALAAFAMTANAQWVLGGNIAFDHNGESTDEYSDKATTEFTLMPKIGYWLNDNMQVGISFGCTYDYLRNYTGDNNNDHYRSTTQWSWNFAPYFRYNLTSWKNFTVFCEAQLGLSITPKSSWKNTALDTDGEGNTNAFALNFDVTPGLNYALTDNISLDVYVDLLGLYYKYEATTTNVGGVETTDYSHNYGLKANMNAQPFLGLDMATPAMVGHLTLFRVGFNYAF